MNYQRVKSLYEHFDVEEANDRLCEAFAARDLKPEDIELGALFVECFGWHEFNSCRRGGRDYLAHDVMTRALTEAEGAVSTSAFLNITGQVVYSAVLDAYATEKTVFMDLIPEVPTMFLDGEKLPGITQIGDEAEVRKEGDPYALAGVTEDWIFTPPVKDRGFTIPVTWEAVFADRTGGKMLERCKEGGKWLKINREKRAIDCLIDENTTAHRYNWRGTTIASYGDNSGTHSWDNLAATNTLLDWSSVNTAEQVFNAITDPYTGEPTDFEPTHLVVTKQLEQTARRIIRAGEIRVTTPGYATSANPTQTVAENPYSNKYQLATSKLLATRLATDTDWFLCDPKAYAAYMVAEKMNTLQAPTGNVDEFRRRIVAEFRANERGAYVVKQPRASVKSTVA